MNNSISLSMIVKNEEKNLTRCLNSVKDIVDEIIVVDTGSTDKTVEIAKSFGAKVYFHPWEGSFSKARNYSLKYATCDWILYLDADEELQKGDGTRLKEIVKSNDYEVVSLVIKNKFKDSKKEGYAGVIRLFKNFIGIYYEGIVHNAIVYKGRCLGSSVSIIHHGYNLSEEEMQKKFLRTTALLKKQIKAGPNNPIPHRYLGISYMSNEMFDEAIEESLIALELVEKMKGKYSEKLFLVSYYVVCASFYEKGDLEESERYALKLVEVDGDFLDGHCILSFVYYSLKKYDMFLVNSEKYLSLWNGISAHPERSKDLFLHTIGHKWNIHLFRGLYFLSTGNIERGNIEINMALEEASDNRDCLRLLGDYYIEHGNYDMAEETYERLLDVDISSTETMVKLGQVKFKQGDTRKTIFYWKEATKIGPDLFDIRLLICKLNLSLGNIEEIVSECDQLLSMLDIPVNLTIDSMSDLGGLFNIIGDKLKEKHDVQAAETAFRIYDDFKNISQNVPIGHDL